MEHQMWSGAPRSCDQMWEFAQIANFASDNLAFRWEFEELRPEGEKGQTFSATGEEWREHADLIVANTSVFSKGRGQD